MKPLVTFFAIFIVVGLGGCATGRLHVDSSPPQADLYVKLPGSSDYKNLGKSPLDQKLAVVRGLVSNAKSVVIEARMAGYLPKSVLITDIDTTSDIRLQLDMTSLKDAQVVNELNGKNLAETNQLIDQLFEAQRLAQVGRLQDAGKRLDDLQKKYPNLAAIYEMQGGIAFMQADYNRALDAYTLAVQNDPENLKIINMRDYLQRKLQGGVRTPAGSKP